MQKALNWNCKKLPKSVSIAVGFPVITLSNEVQFSHSGTVLETRGQDLSFGTKNYGIFGFTDRDISSLDRSYMSPTVGA